MASWHLRGSQRARKKNATLSRGVFPFPCPTAKFGRVIRAEALRRLQCNARAQQIFARDFNTLGGHGQSGQPGSSSAPTRFGADGGCGAMANRNTLPRRRPPVHCLRGPLRKRGDRRFPRATKRGQRRTDRRDAAGRASIAPTHPPREYRARDGVTVTGSSSCPTRPPHDCPVCCLMIFMKQRAKPSDLNHMAMRAPRPPSGASHRVEGHRPILRAT